MSPNNPPDVSNESATNIASVLKLYMRQLPEPLLDAKLYDAFLAAVKVSERRALLLVYYSISLQTPTDAESQGTDTVATRLHDLIEKMPKVNQDILKFLLLHWRRYE
jgi:hypothetical protein